MLLAVVVYLQSKPIVWIIGSESQKFSRYSVFYMGIINTLPVFGHHYLLPITYTYLCDKLFVSFEK